MRLVIPLIILVFRADVSQCIFLDCFFNMFNVTNIIIFFFIHTLTHYVITRFLRFPEGFLLYAVAILSLVLVRET